MWALAHPLRLRMFELLSEGPATASQLARRLGESRGSTSYHLRVLARFGAIEEEPSLGTRRERWWRRPEERVVWPTPLDPEARAITDQLMATVFAREAEVRRRFVTGDVGADWRRQAFVGNWVVELTPDEADELGRRLFALVDELRQRRPPRDAEQALVAVSVLPVLGEAV